MMLCLSGDSPCFALLLWSSSCDDDDDGISSSSLPRRSRFHPSALLRPDRSPHTLNRRQQ